MCLFFGVYSVHLFTQVISTNQIEYDDDEQTMDANLLDAQHKYSVLQQKYDKLEYKYILLNQEISKSNNEQNNNITEKTIDTFEFIDNVDYSCDPKCFPKITDEYLPETENTDDIVENEKNITKNENSTELPDIWYKLVSKYLFN